MPLIIGVCVKVIISKSHHSFQKHGIDEIVSSLKDQLDLALYEMYEDENHVIWVIKNEVLEKQLLPFTERQHQYFVDQQNNKEIIAALQKTLLASEIIALARERQYVNFQLFTGANGIAVGKWSDYLRYKYETIIYYHGGKAVMEEYSDLFRYLEQMIRLQSNEFPIAGAVRITV